MKKVNTKKFFDLEGITELKRKELGQIAGGLMPISKEDILD